MVESGSKWEIWEVNVFRGIASINLDAKGRLALPTRYRERLQQAGAHLVVTIDTDAPCLLLYPLPEWEEIERKIENLPSFNRTTRRIQRLLIGHATEVEMDGNGRILLPNLLREYAGLEKVVMLVGQGKKFELWDEARWNTGRTAWLAEEGDRSEDLPTELQTLSL